MMQSSEDIFFISIYSANLRCLHAKQQAGTAFCAGMLREQQQAGPRVVRGRAKTKPCCERYARSLLRRDAAKIEHHCAETARLQE